MNGSILRIHLMFGKVRHVPFTKWPSNILKEVRPGDLLLDDGEHGKRGGLLCLRSTGPVFITLTADQIYGEEDIPWPDPAASFDAICLRGNTVELKKYD